MQLQRGFNPVRLPNVHMYHVPNKIIQNQTSIFAIACGSETFETRDWEDLDIT